MSHYFINDESLKDELKKISVNIKNQKYEFLTNSGVFSKEGLDFGSRLLIETIKNDNFSRIADVGCGYGPIGIVLAKENPESTVWMYDINERAIKLAETNAELNQVKNVKIKENDALDNVKEKFDLVVTNPPIRAGKKIVFKIYEQAYERLEENGSFYCVIQKKQGAPSSFEKLSELFSTCEIVAKLKGYWIIFAKK
ncbi:class I SAM-dependent methyltransferase [Haploplasma axanthum]|uniref:Protoporphyrinogen oxidase n=1 Tax=Haploplasma axanthum TaxID=29552 RepID=A0A449BCP5_HAPAX|nr:class I SAM-dependent methyltransferase [Haploplasma axanthum]VEU80197.1 protoporphyrinogen oxidase [Haploplasma axanthum]